MNDKAGVIVRKTVFSLVAPDARTVSVTGNFNGWGYPGFIMTRDRRGRWKVNLSLEPGTYQYRFIVDEAWQNDPASRARVPNPYGSLNDVLEVV